MAPVEWSVILSPRGGAALGPDHDCTVVWLGGEHDLFTAAPLSEAMARAIALDDGDVVVDLSDVQFMGTATVRIMVEAGELLRSRSRSLALRRPSRCARRVLDVCGYGNLLDPAEATPVS